jgi:two-component system, NtrC family, sensor kinase
VTVAQVLVVEDETLQRALIGETLRAEGHLELGVGSAEEALELLHLMTVDVAVVDVHLPGLSGVEVLRAIREVSPHTEVVIVTSRPSVETAVTCLQAGAFDFLLKPIEGPALAASITRALEHGRQRWRAAIHEAGHALLSNPDPGALPEQIVRKAREVLGADEASLLLPQPDGKLVVAAADGKNAGRFAGVRLAMGERVAGRVAQERRPALLPERIADDPRFVGLEGHGRVASSIVHPLVWRHGLQGVLTFGRHAGTRPFRESDLEWAGELCRAVASALDQSGHRTHEGLAAVCEEVDTALAAVIAHLASVEDALGEALPPGALAEGGELGARLRDAVRAAREASDGGRRLARLLEDLCRLTDGRGRGEADPKEILGVG